MWRWEHGRQGSGYKKLTLLSSKLLKFDVHILVIPEGVSVPVHRDPSPEGYGHHRVNITLRKPNAGGHTFIEEGVNKSTGQATHKKYTDRWYRFRPDRQEHFVTRVLRGELRLLSIGWLSKE